MSSGNLLADRRMEFARGLHERGDVAEAIDLLEQGIALVPDWVDGLFLRGEWLAGTGRRDEAITAYRRCLELDPADRNGAILRLALLGAVAAPLVPPPAYVAKLFDDYAARFERALVGALDYTVPGALHELVTRFTNGAGHARILDLGCGTGLAGEYFRTDCAWLEGIDLSCGMIDRARRKVIYDKLLVSDAVGFLSESAGRYDLIVAADVLIYFGDLSLLTTAAAGALTPGGRLAFSVEASERDGFELAATQRYAHSAAYLRDTLARTGFAVEALVSTICRLEAGAPVAGYLVVARKPALADRLAAVTPLLGDTRHRFEN